MIWITACAGIARGGEHIQVTLQLSPTYEKFNNRGFIDTTFGFKLSYNFGMEYKHFLSPGTSFATGVLFQNKGFRNVIGPADRPSLLYTKSVVVVGVYYVSIPTNLNFHIRSGKKSRILITTGLVNGILMNQVQEGRRIREGEEQQFLMGEEVSDSRRKLSIFSKRFTGLNIGVGYSKYIKSKMIFEIHPLYTRQLNKAISRNAPVQGQVRPKLDSFAVDFRLGYYFTRQIKNYKKPL